MLFVSYLLSILFIIRYKTLYIYELYSRLRDSYYTYKNSVCVCVCERERESNITSTIVIVLDLNIIIIKQKYKQYEIEREIERDCERIVCACIFSIIY